MNSLLKEWYYRLKYTIFCLVMVDDSWDMSKDLTGSIWPFGGFWIDEEYNITRRYEK